MKQLFGRGLKSTIQAGSRWSPELTGRLAYGLFCTPFPLPLTDDEKRMRRWGRGKLDTAEQHRIKVAGKSIQVYRFHPAVENSPIRGTVVLVHGWTSAATDMTLYVDPLLELGYRVVSLDLPAHGRSDGKMTNIRECAIALQRVIRDEGTVDALVTHSFGGAVSALATEGGAPLSRGVSVGRIAMLAGPNRITSVAGDFGRLIGLNPRAQAAYEARLAKSLRRPLVECNGSDMYRRVGVPLLLVHSRDDPRVRFDETVKYRELGDQVREVALDGLGHRRLLISPEAIAAVVEFIEEGFGTDPVKG